MVYVGNPVMRGLLRSPAGGPMRRQFMVLRFFGRKTGRRYDVPVVAHRLGDELYSLTDARWRNNFRGGADGSRRALRQDGTAWRSSTWFSTATKRDCPAIPG